MFVLVTLVFFESLFLFIFFTIVVVASLVLPVIQDLYLVVYVDLPTDLNEMLIGQ